jgi:Putative Ig domain
VAAPVPPCQMVGGTTYCYTPGSDGNAGNDGTNGAGGSAASVDLYTATPIPVSITTTSLPTGTIGHFYAATVGISGGEGPFTWSEAGSLPPGLRFDASTGQVTGTPKATGSYSITAQVTDNGDPGSQPVSQPLTITINATAPGFQISTASLPAAQPKTAYGPFQLRTTGASAGASFKWQKVSLPKGIKLSTTGVLSGTLGKKLQAGTSAKVSVRVTETVVTKVGKKKVKTRTVASDSWTLAIT